MPLPKINSPIFELTLPSTKQTVKYRPFLVKEQKILLMAMESNDQNANLVAIKQIINNCAIDKVDVEKMPTFDLEYFFINLRAKSIGESVELRMRHRTGYNDEGVECDHTTLVNINLTEIEVDQEIGHTDNIVIDEENQVGIKMKYPTLDAASLKHISKKSKNQMDAAMESIVNCIEYIYDKEEIYKTEDITRTELIEFIDNLSQEQFMKINNFFTSMPKVKKEIEWTCGGCGSHDKVTLEGMSNFFVL
jgi:hypothetical protein